MALTRRPFFWIAYAVLAVACVVVAWRLFPLAMPIVNLEIRLTGPEAVAAARDIAAKRGLAPPQARSAVRFAHDGIAQNYVELEGGGKSAFTALVDSGVYAPYWWEIRLFEPGEIAEARVHLKPDGSPYEFLRKLPETFAPPDPDGLALDEVVARRIAEDEAAAHWGVDLARYRPLEQRQERRANGRIDHLFVYEHRDARWSEARIRMRLAVAGNVPTEVGYFMFVPQSFDRRYAELRAANNSIAGAATLGAGLLYGLGGCVVGVLWLLRRHWLLWRPSLAAGLAVGALLGGASLAGIPAGWFGYDTAEPALSFLGRQVGSAAFTAAGSGLALAYVFMAAEGLTRRAFADHPQLWRIWSRNAAATRPVLGRTLGGYLFVPLELALIAVFYYATNRWLGWWQPSEALTDPNILGSAVPALGPIAMALQAGFMEECAFRAIPLAGAAIIGARFGVRNQAIAVALVVQALVFGAAHANYPGFPSYSRAVELFLPALLWGLVYLRFGLLPVIILHAVFDLALMSIPLFLVDAPGAMLQRAIVVFAGAVPLLVVLQRRLRTGGFGELAMNLRNVGWQAPVPPPRVEITVAERPLPGWMRAFHRLLPVLGIVGAVLWVLGTSFAPDVPTLPLARGDAIRIADAALEQRGVTLGEDWKRFARVRIAVAEGSQAEFHDFVWREAGPEAYRELVGGVLAPPLWEVRFARFTGDVAERVEEWRITVAGDGRVRQLRHALPEARPGRTLEREAAEAIARAAVRDRFAVDPDTLRLTGAEQKEQTARRDWSFQFVDPARAVGEGGEARLQVTIAGDEVVDAGRYVFVPEQWERTERERQSRMTFLKLALAGFAGLAVLAAIVAAALHWMRGDYDRRAFAWVASISFALAVAGLANNWPQQAMNLRTSDPVLTQSALAIVGGVLAALFTAIAAGLAAAIGAWSAARQPPQLLAGRWPAWAGGIAGALLVAGLAAGAAAFAPETAPAWPAYRFAGQAFPALGAALAGASVIGATAGALFVLAWLRFLTHGWQRHLWLAAVLLVVVLTAIGIVGAARPLAAVIGGLFSGAVAVLVVYGLLRLDLRSVPAYVATGVVLGYLEGALRDATVASYIDGMVACVATIAVTIAVTRYLDGRSARPAESAGA